MDVCCLHSMHSSARLTLLLQKKPFLKSNAGRWIKKWLNFDGAFDRVFDSVYCFGIGLIACNDQATGHDPDLQGRFRREAGPFECCAG